MKKTLITPITGILLFLLTSMQPQTKPTPTSEKKACGPTFVFTNPGGYAVTKISVHVSAATNYQYDINNPTFPYFQPETGIGIYTFIFYFSGSASGAITVTDWGNNFIACESFEAPHLSPVVFQATCAYYYLELTNSGC
jgi:hypothetical protein